MRACVYGILSICRYSSSIFPTDFPQARKIRVNLNSMRSRRRSVSLVSDARDLSLILNRFSFGRDGSHLLAWYIDKRYEFKVQNGLDITGRFERLCHVIRCKFFYRVYRVINNFNLLRFNLFLVNAKREFFILYLIDWSKKKEFYYLFLLIFITEEIYGDF